MQKHVKIYLSHFDYTTADFCPCEVCNGKAVDIHHIQRRGSGGNQEADRIENLMALCRGCHREYGDLKHCKHLLLKIHNRILEAKGKEFDKNWMQEEINKY